MGKIQLSISKPIAIKTVCRQLEGLVSLIPNY